MVVEEKVQSIQVMGPELPTEEEIAAQQAIEVFDQGTGPMEVGEELADRRVGGIELTLELPMKSGRLRPIRLSRGRKMLKREQFSHRGQREAVLLSDGFEALIEACGEAK
ncbi:MAG: hypothetical protein WAN46_14535 [Gammaproteobacteria bacterium]